MHPPDTIMIFAFWPLAGQRSAFTAMRPCGEQSRRSTTSARDLRIAGNGCVKKLNLL